MKKLCKVLLVFVLCISILAGCSRPPKANADTVAANISSATQETLIGESANSVSESTVASEQTVAQPADAKESQNSNESGNAVPNLTQQQNTSAAPSAPQNTSTPTSAKALENTITCTISIDCKTAVGVKKVPNGGTILGSKKVTLKPGATVYDALKASGVSFSGKGYISAIGNVSEGDCGPKSGWMYSVNGKYSNVGCAKFTLSSGDNIRWRYTCNMGADIGA